MWHRSTYSIRTSCHFARFTLDSNLSPHILYSTHSTRCLFTIVVNYINYNHTSLSRSAVTVQQLLPSRCMDPTTAHQQPSPGNKLALSSNSDERVPSPADDGASDDAAVDDDIAQSPLSRESEEDGRAQDSWMDLDMSFTPADGGAGHPFLMHERVLSYDFRGTMAKADDDDLVMVPLSSCKSPPCRRPRFRTAWRSLPHDARGMAGSRRGKNSMEHHRTLGCRWSSPGGPSSPPQRETGASQRSVFDRTTSPCFLRSP